MGITYVNRPKQPYEEIPVSVDFANRIPSGENISSVSVKCFRTSDLVETTDTMIKNPSVSGTKAYFTTYGGTSGTSYKITIRAVSATSKPEEDLVIEVMEF